MLLNEQQVKKPAAKKAAPAAVKKDTTKPVVAKKLTGAAAKSALKADLLKRAQALLDEADAAGFVINTCVLKGKQVAGILPKT